MARTIDYLDVPGVDTMHARMGVLPTLETDLQEYMVARDELFSYQPLRDVPLDHLHATQDLVNPDRVAALATLPEQLSKPVWVLQNGEDYYLMNGHHRVAASGYAGASTISARVLDTTAGPIGPDMHNSILDRVLEFSKARWHDWARAVLLKHGDGSHDEEDHGNWARGGSSAADDTTVEGAWPRDTPFPDGDGDGPFGGLTPEQAAATVRDRIVEFAQASSIDADDLLARYENWKETIAENEALQTDKVYEHGANGLPMGQWEPARLEAIRSIVNDYYEEHGADVPNEFDALLMGGLPGAGKGYALSDLSGLELGYHENENYLVINPDTFKALLVKNGLAPEVEGLSGGELAPLLHEESSYMAKLLFDKAISDGKNIIYDWTMSSRDSVIDKLVPLTVMHDGNYAVTAGYIDTPPHVALDQAIMRWIQPGQEGRVIDFEFLAQNPHTPRNLESFLSIREDDLVEDSILIHRNEDGTLEVQARG